MIGLLGLALLGGEAANSAVKILLKQIKSGDTALPSGVFFLAMLVGIYLESNAHQIFHFRSVWLGLVLLEATHSRMMFPSAKMAFERQTGSDDKMFMTPEKSSPLMERRDSSVAGAK